LRPLTASSCASTCAPFPREPPGALAKHLRDRRNRNGDSADSDADADVAAAAALLAAPATNGADAAGGKRPKTAAYDATHVPPVTLEWSDLGYELTTKGGDKKQILKGVRGSAAPGRLLAIM
jgi:hypothetical protein